MLCRKHEVTVEFLTFFQKYRSIYTFAIFDVIIEAIIENVSNECSDQNILKTIVTSLTVYKDQGKKAAPEY